MKRIFVLFLMVAVLLSAIGCTPTPTVPNSSDETNGDVVASEKIRVAFLYDTPVGDSGWITGHDKARKEIDLLPNVETTYVDNIAESDGWSYMNNFAREGYDVVFSCSFGYMDDCLDAAQKNPETNFMHCAGYKTAENMGNYFGRNYEGAYLAGMACASVTKSNVLGYVAPHPIAEVIRNINAFAIGAKEVNPEAKVKIVWINTWYDPTKASDAAESLIAAGADALFHYENSAAVVQTAARHGVYAAGQHSDTSSYAPEACLTSSVWNWEVLYSYVVEKIENGTWESESIWWGMKEGLVDIAELSNVVPEVSAKKIMETRDRLKQGDETADPFYGEVVDQSGRVRIPDGVVATFDEIMSMDYLVDNVQGEIPQK